MTRRALGFLLVLALVAASCGDDGPALSEEEQAAADALAAVIVADDDPANPLADPADAQCVADGLVAEFGVARLDELGLSPELVDVMDLAATGAGMLAEEREAFVAVFGGCVDVGDVYAAAVTQSGLSEEEARCLVGEIDESVWLDGMLAELSGEDWSILGDPDTSEAMASALAECVDLGPLLEAELVASGFTEAQAACVGAGLTDEMVADLLSASFTGEEVDVTQFPEFMQLASVCAAGE